MKKALLVIISSGIIFTASAQKPKQQPATSKPDSVFVPKPFTATFDSETTSFIYNLLNSIKNILPRCSVPMDQGVAFGNQADSAANRIILNKYNSWVASTKRDSIAWVMEHKK